MLLDDSIRVVFVPLACSISKLSSLMSSPCAPERARTRLMALAWGLFMPIGIISARFSPNFATIGFPVHRALQSVGATLALAGFFVAISFTQDSGKCKSRHCFFFLIGVGVCFRSAIRKLENHRSKSMRAFRDANVEVFVFVIPCEKTCVRSR